MHLTATFRPRRLVLFAAAAVLPLIATGCARKPQVQAYRLEGRIIGIDKAHHMVNVDSKAIPGYMDAMRMDYSIPDDAALASLKAGDQIEATLKVSEDRTWLESIRIVSAPK
ncbi:MAG: copper-binding protein [Acidobacteria bacterium]|nr:copper-binding protein [Acidobacteriota bacterium]